MSAVKNTILLPAFFLFLLLLLLAALTALHVLHQTSAPSPGSTLTLLQRLPRSVETLLPAACIGALLLLYFRMAFRPGNRLLSFGLLFGSVFAVLALGQIGLGRITAADTSGGTAVERTLEERRIYRLDGGALYVGEVDGARLRRLVYVRPQGSPEEGALIYVAEARLRKTPDGAAAVDLAPAVGAAVTLPAERAAGDVLRPGDALMRFARDYDVLVEDMTSLRTDRPGQFLLLCASLSAFVLGAFVWMRITRWPLFNFLAALLVVRGGLFLYALLRLDLARELGGFFFSESFYIRALPSVVLLALGVLFLLIDILFVPYDRFGARRQRR